MEKRPAGEGEIAELLEKLDKYIVNLARKRIPRYTVRPGEHELEIDELAQQTRVKLWMALCKSDIANPAGYAGSIVYTEAVNMQRRFKSMDTVSQRVGEQLRTHEMQDPTLDIEQCESMKACVAKAAQAIRALPPCQRQAMICALKDARDDTSPLLAALQTLGIDVESIRWPEDKVAVQRMRASLTVSRKKLRCFYAACI